MIKHFDLFKFYNLDIVIACDENDKVMGYACLQNNDELCQVFTKPEYRKKGLADVLIWKCYELAVLAGTTIIWGTAYPSTKDMYIDTIKRFGTVLLEVQPPEERNDGQWKMVFDITTVTPDRKPKFRG